MSFFPFGAAFSWCAVADGDTAEVGVSMDQVVLEGVGGADFARVVEGEGESRGEKEAQDS